ncbi:MAG: hypothetical protein H7A53_07425 [Akkermansiaceae bacterium]|nr:hypothetical protein [Akkermansiaceae bacterium]
MELPGIEVQGQEDQGHLNGTKILDADIDTFDWSQIARTPKGLDHTSTLVSPATATRSPSAVSKVKKLAARFAEAF